MVNEDSMLQWQVVVIIGAAASADDISRDIASTAKEVHIADRSVPVRTCVKQPGYDNLWLHSMVNSLFSWWVKQDMVAFIC
jgi:cation diffusion facilitator CzcD-associated flavoprotein CzcO